MLKIVHNFEEYVLQQGEVPHTAGIIIWGWVSRLCSVFVNCAAM
jgi:hypothetical protein